MLARLWWKEWRTLAPIAAVVAGSAVVVQCFLLYYGGREIREGILVSLGYGWAMLFAFVAGSSSFAGERENRTLGLLDALPVDRRTLWLGKATFALGSSVVMALALMLMGLAGSSLARPPQDPQGFGPIFGGFVLAWALALGLFWSATCRNAITAGVLTVVATGMVPVAVERWLSFYPTIPLPYSNWGLGPLSWAAVFGHLVLIGATLGASWWVIVREVAPSRLWRQSFSFATRPIHLRPALLDRGPRLTLRPSAAFGRVAWQTVREGRWTWLGTVGLALVVPVFTYASDRGDSDLGAVGIGLAVLALLIQGASVFGLENAAGTRQFLDNMAVPPRTVWAAKLAPWALSCTAILVMPLGAVFVARASQGKSPLLDGPADWAWVAFIVAGAGNALAAGMVAGMALNRQITATLVGMIVFFALITPQAAVVGQFLAPVWTLAIMPTILVAATFLWAGDWLAARPGWRRWGRLAALIGVPFAATGLTYAGWRAWSVPDIGPQFGAAPAAASALAEDYRRIMAALASGDSPLASMVGKLAGTEDVRRAIRDQIAANGPAMAEVRRLAAGPGAAWFGPEQSRLNPRAPSDWDRTLTSLLWGLTIEAADRQRRGDMAGAWDDILAQVQIVDQFARGAQSVGLYVYATVKSDWSGQAIAWAKDPRTSLAAIRAAKDALLAVAKVPSEAEAIRADSRRLESDLDRPTADWVEYLTPPDMPSVVTPWSRIGDSWLTAPSWERERTRRVMRPVAALALRNATLGRTARADLETELAPFGPKAWVIRTPLAERLAHELIAGADARDRELANRRAVVVFLALRAWQLTHDGVAPATLDPLIPGELAFIPIDPFARQAFWLGYGPVGEPPGLRDASGAFRTGISPPPSTFALYSVGPDGVIATEAANGTVSFHQGLTDGSPWTPSGDDLTFPLPSNPGKPAAPADAVSPPPDGTRPVSLPPR